MGNNMQVFTHWGTMQILVTLTDVVIMFLAHEENIRQKLNHHSEKSVKNQMTKFSTNSTFSICYTKLHHLFMEEASYKQGFHTANMSNKMKHSMQNTRKLMVRSFRTKSLREFRWLGYRERLRAGKKVDRTIMPYRLGLVHGLGTCSRHLSSLRSFTLLLADTSLRQSIRFSLVFPHLPLEPRLCSLVSVQLYITYLCNQHRNHMLSTHLLHIHKPVYQPFASSSKRATQAADNIKLPLYSMSKPFSMHPFLININCIHSL